MGPGLDAGVYMTGGNFRFSSACLCLGTANAQQMILHGLADNIKLWLHLWSTAGNVKKLFLS